MRLGLLAPSHQTGGDMRQGLNLSLAGSVLADRGKPGGRTPLSRLGLTTRFGATDLVDPGVSARDFPRHHVESSMLPHNYYGLDFLATAIGSYRKFQVCRDGASNRRNRYPNHTWPHGWVARDR
ncbi:hypothetical protein DVH05_017701 [Phytophthora capsici]|nr:hypothetical protein DVH05_017701 [Phytophthora capsici]